MRFTCILTVAAAVAPLMAVLSHAAVVASAAQNENFLAGDSARAARAMVPDATPTSTGNWAVVARVADECAKDADTAACVAVKVAVALERAARALGDVQLLPGVTVAKNDAAPAASSRDSRALPTEDELRGQLRTDNDVQDGGAAEYDRAAKVTDMVVKSAVRFLQSRTIKLEFPQTDADELARSIEEGRAKLKKKVLPILGLLAVKIVAVLPFLLGIIGFFALKALVFGKLALLIAGALAFQKYAGSAGGFGKITADTWGTANAANAWSAPAAPSAGGGYYRRSMEAAAQQMAYNGQMQPSAQTVA